MKNIAMKRVTRGASLRSKGQRSRSLGSWNENVKIIFRAYIRQKRIDLGQTKAKMMSGPFYKSSNTFHQRQYFIFV